MSTSQIHYQPSGLELLASLSESGRAEFYRSLSPTERARINYDWRGFTARPNQLPPGTPGSSNIRKEWRYWLVQAGRGFGKTRTGAETVREWVSQGYRRIHIVGPTAADARDVMVSGESGLLSVFPPDHRPMYEPSKRLLTFHTGAVAYTFSADEPERLRGPQCLSVGTMVLMADGTEIPIESVKAGDYVLTRRGRRRVLKAWMTSTNADVFSLNTLDGRSIIGTGDHRICVTLASNGMGGSGTKNQGGATTRHDCSFIERFGSPNAAQSQMATTFTTLTGISTIIASITWSSYRAARTADCIAERSSTHIKTKPERQRRKHRAATEKSESARAGSNALSVELRMEAELPSRPYIALPDAWRSSAAAFMATAEYANSAELRTRPNVERKSIAGCSATVRPARTGNQFRRGKLFAVIAESRSYPSGPTQLFVQGSAPLLSMREVDSVEPLKLRLPVYDLTIEGEHEFFANGILVHNCEAGWCDEIASWRFPDAWDNFLFGLRLGKDPKAVITSTPKPIKLVRDIIGDPHTVVTRASSYENRANLAPAFFDSIIRKYEGTRIGRQELDAELLEDVPGALWTRALIDATRIRPGEVRWDLIVRIVVAIDPAVSSSATSDETGIVVVALTRSGHVVVLDDLSCRQSPLGWAKVAVAAYRSRQANMIVGEVNNGGDLVAMNVRAVDPLAAFRAVRASRGKYIRAEPVASLYEQGRVHHAGAFERLEDQMCGWTPQGSERSPDRMDALVWGVTELLIDPAPQTLRVPIGGDYQISPI